MTPLDRVLRFARWAGVDVQLVNHVPEAHRAPFDDRLGLRWKNLTLFVERDVETPAVTGGAIHELGHLLATIVPPDSPACAELNFCGWEYRTALRCGVERQWFVFLQNYIGDNSRDFGELSTDEKRAFLWRMTQRGRYYGNVSPSGRPLMLRGPKAEVMT